jgi:septal ring factor EnvC (AmiA/AmiB activator)
MTDSDHIMQLRQQVSNLHARLKRIMEGLEGTCMTCEPVGVRNQQMEQHIKTLQAERDEARREVSKLMGGSAEQHWYANRRGWDCFAEPA